MCVCVCASTNPLLEKANFFMMKTTKKALIVEETNFELGGQSSF